MARTSTKKAEETKETKPVETPAEEKVEETAQEVQEAVSEPKKEQDVLTISRDELNALIASAVASALENQPKTVLAATVSEDPVVLLFLGGIMPGSTVALGELGSIYRDGGTLTVSKEAFFSKLNSTAEYMLRTRQLIVVSGLNDEERERYGVAYKDNELLTDKTYGRLLVYEPEELKTIYKTLCPEHKAIAAKVFVSAAYEGDGRVTPEKVKALARIDRDEGVKDSAFLAMLQTIAPDGLD